MIDRTDSENIAASVNIMSKLVSLPTETVVRILNMLSGDDIQRCRRVCQFIRKTIDCTKQLQYLTELACLGYVEPACPRLDLDYDQKFHLLREHRIRGARPSQTFTLNTSALRPENMQRNLSMLCTGVYVEGFSSVHGRYIRCLNLYQLPSWNCGTELKTWSHENLVTNVVSIALDLDMNLLCLLEILDTTNDKISRHAAYNIHFRTLDSNGPHPGAALPKLTWRLYLPDTRDSNMRIIVHIVGGLLGVLFWFQDGHTLPYLVVWDWVAGLKLLEIRAHKYTAGGFAIINQELVVIHRLRTGGADQTLGHLDIYRINEDHTPQSVIDTNPVATLSLPLAAQPALVRGSSTFYASPSAVSPFDTEKDSWYRPAPKLYSSRDGNYLCLIQCSFRSLPGWLCIPSSTILNVMRKHAPRGSHETAMIAWELWGRQTSWVYQFSSIAHRRRDGSLVSGLRTIAPTQQDRHISIWDFNPHSTRPSPTVAQEVDRVMSKLYFPIETDADICDPNRHVFYGDGTLANQPFRVNKLSEIESSDQVVMHGEHVLNMLDISICSCRYDCHLTCRKGRRTNSGLLFLMLDPSRSRIKLIEMPKFLVNKVKG